MLAVEGNRTHQTRYFDRSGLKEKTRSELVDMLVEIALELKARSDHDTIKVPALTLSPSFDERDASALPDLICLPRGAEHQAGEPPAPAWQILLSSANPDHSPLGLDIRDEITIGRQTETTSPDLDLTPYDAASLGVSREHAMLKPTSQGLLLIDLGSSNGTFCNGTKTRLGAPHLISDGDIVSFGGLHFKTILISWPGK